MGFKPTSGRIPLDGIAPLSPSFDTLGPLTRSVDDAGFLADIMAGDAPRDTGSALPKRIGYVPLAYLDPIDAEIVAGYLATVAALNALGHELVPVDLPCDALEYQRRNGKIVAHEVYAHLGPLARDATRPLDPYVRQRVLVGADVAAGEHETLLAQRAHAIAEMRQIMTDTPVILMPSTPISARKIEEMDETTIPLSRFTRVANYLDLPAISLPMPGLRLPAGVQLMAAQGNDGAVIAGARALMPVVAGLAPIRI